MRLRGARRHTARFARTYDVVLTPTLADETPPIGYLDPTADYQQIIDRLEDWVAFTPLQNVDRGAGYLVAAGRNPPTVCRWA